MKELNQEELSLLLYRPTANIVKAYLDTYGSTEIYIVVFYVNALKPYYVVEIVHKATMKSIHSTRLIDSLATECRYLGINFTPQFPTREHLWLPTTIE